MERKKKKDFLIALKNRKIKKRIIDAFGEFDQSDFFDDVFSEKMYANELIPIGLNETSSPFIDAAVMLNYLDPKKNWRVLEVGTGSGYLTGVLSKLVNEVITIEYYEDFALKAKSRLLSYLIDNVRYFCGDATDYKDPIGEFDAIIIWGACKKRPLSLVNCLKPKAKMIFPIGPDYQQQISILENVPNEKKAELYTTSFHDYCIFPELKGKYGSDL